MIRKNSVKNGYLKSRNLSEEKKPTPSTNILLLSYPKSEQSKKNKTARISGQSPQCSDWPLTGLEKLLNKIAVVFGMPHIKYKVLKFESNQYDQLAGLPSVLNFTIMSSDNSPRINNSRIETMKT